MTRPYAALLRGVSPTNVAMLDLKRAFESAGFVYVKTVLTSGNVVFGARRASDTFLESAAEAAMLQHFDLGEQELRNVRPADRVASATTGRTWASVEKIAQAAP